MKRKVIMARPVDPTPTNLTVNDRKYYGIDADGRGFITREEWEQGVFVVRFANALTRGNSLIHTDTKVQTDLGVLVKNIMEYGHSVYEFDTPKELFEWIAEGFERVG